MSLNDNDNNKREDNGFKEEAKDENRDDNTQNKPEISPEEMDVLL